MHPNCLSQRKVSQQESCKNYNTRTQDESGNKPHGYCCLYWTDFQHYYARIKDNVHPSWDSSLKERIIMTLLVSISIPEMSF